MPDGAPPLGDFATRASAALHTARGEDSVAVAVASPAGELVLHTRGARPRDLLRIARMLADEAADILEQRGDNGEPDHGLALLGAAMEAAESLKEALDV